MASQAGPTTSSSNSSDSIALEREVKEFIISVLALEEIGADEIDSGAPLFGSGLGLDSVDALELGVALQKRYGIRLDPKDDRTKEHFKNVQSLAALIATQRAR